MKKTLACFLLLFSCLEMLPQVKDTMTFAVLGNSISTYYDYIPRGYAVFYSQDRERIHGFQVGDTWWMQLSRLSGMTFLANASWSGSRVSCDLLNSDAPFVSDARVKALARAGVPDLIFILGGTNDWNQAKVPLGRYSSTQFDDSVTFRGAYTMLLHKLTTRYPRSRIVCLSITPRANDVNQPNAQGYSQADANASIRRIASQFGAYYVDMTKVPFSADWGGTTLDRLHPTAKGSELMAKAIYSSLIAQGVITPELKQTAEVDEAEALLDLSFTEEGIVNHGTYESKIGKMGGATTLYDPANDTYYGCTRAMHRDYFYAQYDWDSPLAQAFNANVTWEMLVRLDGLGDQVGQIDRTCFLGNEQDGGWAFYNSSLASTFSYTHESGVKSSLKSITGDSILVSGKFYHLVVTMDRVSHVMRYFVNGKLVCTGTRAGTDMPLPQCGSLRGRRGIWICLGGNPTAGSYVGGATQSSACSFIFVRIYDGALTQRAATALYTDGVKRFTEPRQPQQADLIMDCRFTSEGALNLAPGYADRPIRKVGDVVTDYHDGLRLYQACFDGQRNQFFGYNLGDDPGIMSQLSDAYSVEILCQNSSALPAKNTRPLCFTNGYGFGLQMNAQGDIGYTTTTQGSKADGSYAKSQWTWIGAGSLTEDYTHYVIVYDRQHYTSSLYVDGELKARRWLTFKECPLYEWAPTEWVAIGGDALGPYAQATSVGSYPFHGKVAMVRIWGKALEPSQTQTLCQILRQPEWQVSVSGKGYAPLCLPFAYRLPEGCTACIATEMEAPNVTLVPIAKAGEYVPYGTPVILMGEPGAVLTLSAADLRETDEAQLYRTYGQNLLEGTFVERRMQGGEGYYMRSSSAYLYRTSPSTTLPAFSCFLPSDQRRSYFILDYQDTPDGLPMVRPGQSSPTQAAYNLQGQRIPDRAAFKGIRIVDGKKVLTP